MATTKPEHEALDTKYICTSLQYIILLSHPARTGQSTSCIQVLYASSTNHILCTV